MKTKKWIQVAQYINQLKVCFILGNLLLLNSLVKY